VDVPEPTNEPEPTPSDEPPPGEQLGLDADGTAGGDGFGLVARKGGRDLLSSGGSAFNWYAGLVKNEVLDQLDDDAAIRRGAYSVSVRIWVRPDGTIERALLAQSTGNPDCALAHAAPVAGAAGRHAPTHHLANRLSSLRLLP
jgi:protein TonB